MRTLKGQEFVHDENYSLFPDGAIQNEIEGTQEGTPVVREVYNDFLMNVYAFLRSRKVIPNELEDNASNGYQFINALKRNINELNDIEKVLNIDGSTWNLNIDFSLVPDKYFLIARAAEDSDDTITFIKGTNNVQKPFAPVSFKAGDELLIIMDQGSFRSFNLSSNSNTQSESFPVFGNPLACIESDKKIWYETETDLFSVFPESYNLKTAIESFFGDEPEIRSMVNISGKIVCLVYFPAGDNLRVCYFNIPDFTNVIELIPSVAIGTLAGDTETLMYSDGKILYFTNTAGNGTEDERIAVYEPDFNGNSLVYMTYYDLSSDFVKTTNAVFYSGALYTYYNQVLTRFNLNGTHSVIGTFPNLAGSIILIKQDVYFVNDYNAVKWNI